MKKLALLSLLIPALASAQRTLHPMGTGVPPQPVAIVIQYVGKPTASESRFFLVTFGLSIPANLAGTRCKAGTNPTSTATFSLQKNGSQFGTVAIATNGTTTLTAASPTSFTTSDEFSIVAPGTQDTTLADVRCSIYGTR